MAEDLETRNKFLSNTKDKLRALERKINTIQRLREKLIRDYIIVFCNTDDGANLVDDKNGHPHFQLSIEGSASDFTISKVRCGKDYRIELFVESVNGEEKGEWWTEMMFGEAFPWSFFGYVE